MTRMLFIVGMVMLGLFSATRAGDDRGKSVETKRAALEDELRVLLTDHGPAHPPVLALKDRIDQLTAEGGQGREINPKGLLVVLSKEKVGATLKEARIRTLGGRAFVVGVEVEGPKMTNPMFLGRTVWVPLDDVIQMVEVDDAKAK
jgi:hypothetical protein